MASSAYGSPATTIPCPPRRLLAHVLQALVGAVEIGLLLGRVRMRRGLGGSGVHGVVPAGYDLPMMLAQDVGSPIDFSQPAGQILVVILFLIPGLNCTWIIERLAGRTPLSGTERLLRAIAWSLLIYAVASPWLLRLGHRVPSGKGLWPWEPILVLSAIEFVAPVLLGLAVISIRRAKLFRSRVKKLTRLDSMISSWDFAFAPQGPFFVRAKLRTGERVGGLFREASFASAYPEPQDVFLEQAWRLTEDGTPEQPVPGSRGLLLRQDEVEVLEFIELEVDDGESANH
jgi:uncharacterized protein DUF6338